MTGDGIVHLRVLRRSDGGVGVQTNSELLEANSLVELVELVIA